MSAQSLLCHPFTAITLKSRCVRWGGYTQGLKGKKIVRFNQSCTFGHHRWSLGGYFGVQYLARGHFACRGLELMTFVSLELAA